MENEKGTSPDNMIPPGHYTVKAVYKGPKDIVWGEASGGQKSAQVGLTFEITQGEYKGRMYPWYGSFAEGKATEITMDSLEAAGVTGYEDDNIKKPIGLGSKECIAVIQHRTLQNYSDGQLVDIIDEKTGLPRVIAQIQYINAIGARMKNVMSESDSDSFAEMMKSTVAARRQKKSGAAGGVPKNADGTDLF